MMSGFIKPLHHDAVTNKKHIVFGRESYSVFKGNLIERLEEAFFNVAWFASQVDNKDAFMQEYSFYKKLYHDITELYGKNSALDKAFSNMERKVKNIK